MDSKLKVAAQAYFRKWADIVKDNSCGANREPIF